LALGGVHFIHDSKKDQARLLVWRQRFAAHITANLVSCSNPTGSINSSNLELAGTIAHHDTLAQATDMRKQTCHTMCDNTPVVAW
jgi:hypothetical protein